MPTIFASILPEIRKAQGITQAFLAAQAGINRSAISKFERGETAVGIDTLKRIAEHMNLNPLCISGESSNPFRSDKLIKFLLVIDPQFLVDLIILEFIAMANTERTLKISCIAAPTTIYRTKRRFHLSCTYVFAIAVKDPDGNMFLFRHKSPNTPLYTEIILRRCLLRISDRTKCEFRTRTEKIDVDLARIIQTWTVTRQDIEPLFQKDESAFKTLQVDLEERLQPPIPCVSSAPATAEMSLTDTEREILTIIRQNRIDPAFVLRVVQHLAANSFLWNTCQEPYDQNIGRC
jgi:transcriptional regulator with XRE-family HTH domain